MATFQILWRNFPAKKEIEKTCYMEKDKPFSDYCAIRLSECFIKSGIGLGGFSGRKCWSHSGVKHSLLAEDLAKFIERGKLPGFGVKQVIKNDSFRKDLSNKTGVIFFKDYWQRGSGTTKESHDNRSGDHIDLWDRGSLTDASSIGRQIYELFGIVSELKNSKDIWFWEVK